MAHTLIFPKSELSKNSASLKKKKKKKEKKKKKKKNSDLNLICIQSRTTYKSGILREK